MKGFLSPETEKKNSKRLFLLWGLLIMGIVFGLGSLRFYFYGTKTIKITFDKPLNDNVQLFYTWGGQPFSEKNGIHQFADGLEVKFSIPNRSDSIRIDPGSKPANIGIRQLLIINKIYKGNELFSKLKPFKQVEGKEIRNGVIVFKTTGNDPILLFKDKINSSGLIYILVTAFLFLIFAFGVYYYKGKGGGVLNSIKSIPIAVFKIFIIVTILFVFVPFQPRMPGAGLDSSWILGMNEAISLKFNIGRDIIFTMGPYASIFTLSYHPATDHLMVLGSLILGLCYAFLLLSMIDVKRFYFFSLFLFIMIISGRNSLLFSYVLLLMAFSYKLVRSDEVLIRRNYSDIFKILKISFLFMPLGLLPLIKGSGLFLCLGIQLFIFLYFIYYKRKVYALISLVLPLFSTIIFWMISGQSLSCLPDFYINMLPLISGYSEAMAINGSLFHIIVFILTSIIIFIAMLLSEKKIKSVDALFSLLCFGLFLFFSFKSGFVRHDGHAMSAANGLLFASCTLYLLYPKEFLRLPLLFSFFCWILIDMSFINNSTKNIIGKLENTYVGSFKGIATRIDNPQQLNIIYEKCLKKINEKGKIPRLSGTSDFYTIDQSYLIASDNQWNPRAIFQSYTVYEPKLAKINEHHLRLDKAPDNVIFNLHTVDHRFPTLDDGMSWLALLDNYQATDYIDGNIFFKKKHVLKKVSTLKTLFEREYMIGENIVLPNSDNILFSEVDIEPTLVGRLFGIVYKLPQLNIRVKLDNGNEKVFRTISKMMETGFIVSPFIQSTEQFATFLCDQTKKQYPFINSFSIEPIGGSSIFWKSHYKLKLKEFKVDDTKHALNGLFNSILDNIPENYTKGIVGHFDGSIDVINGKKPSLSALKCTSYLKISGWLAISAKEGIVPEETFIILDNGISEKYIKANRTERPDVKKHYNHPDMPDVGFSAVIDLGELKGNYTLGLAIGNKGKIIQSKQFNIPIEIE